MREPILTGGDLSPKICFKISPQQEFTFYGRDEQVVGTMNFSRTPAFEGSLDESAHLFFNGVANLWHNEISDLRAKLRTAEAEVARLKETLAELYAMVKGECPSLLDEDCGGNSRLDLQISAALEVKP